jgi:hypothetical protein
VKISPPPAPPKPTEQFPPSGKKGRYFDIPDGIIAHMTRECSRNVHDRHVVDVTCGSFEKTTVKDHDPKWAPQNAANLETGPGLCSAFRDDKGDIPHGRNSWFCYDFKERAIVPTHYTIRSHGCIGPPKSWLVETSADKENWQEVAREEDNKRLNGTYFTGAFAVADGGEYRFIRLVNIGRNHPGNDILAISVWGIFGMLIE